MKQEQDDNLWVLEATYREQVTMLNIELKTIKMEHEFLRNEYIKLQKELIDLQTK
jgi:hypothetical protein